MAYEIKQIQNLSAKIHHAWEAFKDIPAPAAAPATLAAMIDHTLLKPEASRRQIEALCDEAAEYRFASVCVNPVWVPLCANALRGSAVKVCTVIGFPLGASSTVVKAAETMRAIDDGATEVDMVLAVGLLKSGLLEDTLLDIHAVVDAAHQRGVLAKVILETCLLSEEEKLIASQLSVQAGADFVKTSTGFSTGGATREDVFLLRQAVGPDIGVKASGGIRTYADAISMIHAGASRLGASAGVKIVQEARTVSAE